MKVIYNILFKSGVREEIESELSEENFVTMQKQLHEKFGSSTTGMLNFSDGETYAKYISLDSVAMIDVKANLKGW